MGGTQNLIRTIVCFEMSILMSHAYACRGAWISTFHRPLMESLTTLRDTFAAGGTANNGSLGSFTSVFNTHPGPPPASPFPTSEAPSGPPGTDDCSTHSGEAVLLLLNCSIALLTPRNCTNCAPFVKGL